MGEVPLYDVVCVLHFKSRRLGGATGRSWTSSRSSRRTERHPLSSGAALSDSLSDACSSPLRLSTLPLTMLTFLPGAESQQRACLGFS